MLDINMAILSLENINESNKHLVGKRAYELGRISKIAKIPQSFVITNEVFDYIIDKSGIKNKVLNFRRILKPYEDEKIQNIANEIQKLTIKVSVPDEVKEAIKEAYQSFGIDEEKSLKDIFAEESESIVDIKTSPIYPKEGNNEITHIHGIKKVLEAMLFCFASHFTAQPFKNRLENNLSDKGLGVIIQKSLDPQISGVVYASGSGPDKKIIIKAVYGLQSTSTENFYDAYTIDYDTLQITDISNHKQPFQLNKSFTTHELIRTNIDTEKADFSKLTDNQIGVMAEHFKEVLDLFNGNRAIEFMIENNKLFITDISDLDEKNYEPIMSEETSFSDDYAEEDVSSVLEAENSIFTMFKKEDDNEESEFSERTDFPELKVAEHMMGQAIAECYLAIVRRLQEKYQEFFNDDTVLEFSDLVAIISKETTIPYISELLKIKELRNRFVETGKTPNIFEVKFAFENARNFFKEF